MAPADHPWWNQGTVAVITGGHRGIGLETVRQLAQRGLTVVLTTLDRDLAAKACDSLIRDGLKNVDFHELDVTIPDSIDKFEEWMRGKYGVVDILVNNAGAPGITINFQELEANNFKLGDIIMDASVRRKCAIPDIESGKTCIATNYYGAKRTIEALRPLFRTSPPGARIVNVSSSWGQLQHLPNESLRQKLMHPQNLTENIIDGVLDSYLKDLEEGHLADRGWPDDFASYKMSKMGLNAYTRVLARELESRPEGQKIYANVVDPGWTRTDMSFHTGEQTPSEAAERVVWLALLPPGSPSGQFFGNKKPCRF